ncbi:MAG: hypothetical protein FJY07_00825 [Bacteroidetes bacterium]|nr:hypothetical protein [Bacteroidota bacterium]
MRSYLSCNGTFDFDELSLSFNDGVIFCIDLYKPQSGWNVEYFPKEWNVKVSYKDMQKTNKQYPKPKDDAENIYLNINYNSLDVRFFYEADKKGNRELKQVKICRYTVEFIESPGEVWKYFIGEEGLNLEFCLYENINKTLNSEFLATNFIDIYGSVGLYNKTIWNRFNENGNFYFSKDGSTILKLDNDNKLKGIVFYQKLIPVNVFQPIDSSTHYVHLKKRLPQIKEDSQETYTAILTSDNFETFINYTSNGNVSSVMIQYRENSGEIKNFSQFPFSAAAKNDIALTPKYESINVDTEFEETYNEIMLEASESRFKLDKIFEVKLKEGQTAIFYQYFQEDYEIVTSVLSESGVNDIELGYYKGGNRLLQDTSLLDNGETHLEYYYTDPGLIQIRIKNQISGNPNQLFRFRICLFARNSAEFQCAIMNLSEDSKQTFTKNGLEHDPKNFTEHCLGLKAGQKQEYTFEMEGEKKYFLFGWCAYPVGNKNDIYGLHGP